jgi:chromosome segregation ATPase
MSDDQKLRDELAVQHANNGKVLKVTSLDVDDGVINFEIGETHGFSQSALESFKTGWDAARANEPDDVRAGEVKQLSDCLQLACDERDDLKVEVERLTQLNKELVADSLEHITKRLELSTELDKCKVEYADYVRGRPGSWYVTQLQKERDELRTEVEDLKQKLTPIYQAVEWTTIKAKEKLAMSIAQDALADYNKLCDAVEKLADALEEYKVTERDLAADALAEYRAKFPKENK